MDLPTFVIYKLLTAKFENPSEIAIPCKKFSLGDEITVVVANSRVCGIQNELITELHLP